MSFRSAVVLVTLVLAACGSTFTSADRDAVVAVLRTQEQAWNRGDLDAFMTSYLRGPDLVFTSGSRIRRGWDETYRKYRDRYGAAPDTMGRLSFEILGVQPIGVDGAVVLGRWKLTDTPNAGGGVFSVVLERRAEGWRIVHDHTSSDA